MFDQEIDETHDSLENLRLQEIQGLVTSPNKEFS